MGKSLFAFVFCQFKAERKGRERKAEKPENFSAFNSHFVALPVVWFLKQQKASESSSTTIKPSPFFGEFHQKATPAAAAQCKCRKMMITQQ